jgi:hypothetical protein
MTDQRDLVHIFADHAATVTYENLPDDARMAAKKSILDTLGVILAASGSEPAVRGVVEIVKETGGKPESTILASGAGHLRSWQPLPMVRLPIASITMTRPLGDSTRASSIIPAAFAVAERRGGVSGQDLIAAVAVGQDIFSRLRCHVEWKKDWNLSTVLAVFAATASAGRVMGLSAQRPSRMRWELQRCSPAASWRWLRAGAAICAVCMRGFRPKALRSRP